MEKKKKHVLLNLNFSSAEPRCIGITNTPLPQQQKTQKKNKQKKSKPPKKPLN